MVSVHKSKPVKHKKQVQPDKVPGDFHSLQDVLAWSYANNPSLLSARAGLRATEEDLPQALSGFQPNVNAGANITNEHISGAVNHDGTTSKQADASFVQPVFHGGQTLAQVKGARDTIEAQRALLHDREQQILLQATTAYMNVVRDEALLKVADNNVHDLQEQYKAASDRFRVGAITKTDVAQSEAALAKAQADRTAALGNLRTSNAVFEQIVGFPPGTVSQPETHLPIPSTLDEATDFADRFNPQIIASSYLHKFSQSEVDRIFGKMLPQVDLSGDVERNFDPQPGGIPDNTTRVIGLTATIPLYTGGLLSSQVRQAKFTANQKYLDTLDTRRQIRQNVVSGWETLAATRAEIDSREAQVKASRTALEGIRQEADVGTRTVLDALNTEQDYLNAEVALVTAQRDEVVAAFTLADAMGLLTPSTLGFPEISHEETPHSGHVDKGRVE
ncbi:MAG TPA: TolC family outer membrane protein [Patescibacteria group bacterium]|nr:TolC family outer membrane protein [Patescibacteria group bacterium]